MRALCFLVLAGFSPALLSVYGQSSPVDSVNEYIGTANEGQTFPATGPPFAMTQWTPQTREGNTKCVSPYYFADTRIEGFRGSHFLSGSCTQDYGAVTLMPLSGSLTLGPTDEIVIVVFLDHGCAFQIMADQSDVVHRLKDRILGHRGQIW